MAKKCRIESVLWNVSLYNFLENIESDNKICDFDKTSDKMKEQYKKKWHVAERKSNYEVIRAIGEYFMHF